MRTLLNRLPRTRIKLAVARKLYLALRLVLRRDRYCIERGGISYEVDLSEGLDLSLFLFGSFQKHVTDDRYIKIPEDSIVIDVGANAGLMSLRYARTAVRGRVYAFEPTYSGYERLKRNLSLNPELAARVIPVQAFVSDVAESNPHITAYPSWNLKSTIKKNRHPIHGGVPESATGIRAVTLDEFFSAHHIDRVDLIKIDTDGHEFHVLRGAKRIIEQHRPTIIFEVGLYLLKERDISFDQFCELFLSIDYRMINAKNGRVITIDNYDQEIPSKATIDIIAFNARTLR